MTDQKRACLVYVSQTEADREATRNRLSQNGYAVCEVKAELGDAVAAQAGDSGLPTALTECITGSDLCVFLLPELGADDCLLGDAGGFANKLGKSIVGIVAGNREKYPDAFEDCAKSMVREGSPKLDDAICGAEIWENPDRTPGARRTIDHVRCQ